jgi:hypothetical protein
MSTIETVLRSLYKNKKYGELSSLYKLFDEKLGDTIASQLTIDLNLCNSAKIFEKIYVDFQWIDKIPLASFVKTQKDINGNVISNKTEIGDLFIQYRHTNAFGNNGNSEVHKNFHRSLVVQAKLASEDNPTVPIGRISKNRVNSTSKELKLLEDWPEFDLYETSRSSTPIAKNLSVSIGQIPFAFYGGFTNSSKLWSFGIAKNGEVCSNSFSDIILKLAKKEAGKEISTDSAWEIITCEITKTCRNRNIPPSIAKGIESRNKTKSVEGGVFYSFPAPLFNSLRWVFDKRVSLFVRKKMLVLTIDRVSYEGLEMEKHR